MAKLFAMEAEDHVPGGTLLIDKVIEESKQPKSPMALTTELLKQRQGLKQELDDAEKEAEAKKDEDSGDGSDGDNEDDGTDSAGDGGSNDDGDGEGDNEDNKDDKSDKSDDEDDVDLEDKDSVKGLIGSGLKDEGGDKSDDKKDADKGDKDKEDKDVATESFSGKAITSHIFKPLHLARSSYISSLGIYAMEAQAVDIKDHPIVYVKEPVITSLNNLVAVATSYITNNNKLTDGVAGSVKEINERLTVFGKLQETRAYNFTHKLVTDRDILTVLSVKEKSDIRETVRLMANYLNQSATALSLVVSNKFDEMRAAFTTSGFIEDNGDLRYNKPIPGFNLVTAATANYTNYLDTKIENFNYYIVKNCRTQDLFELDGISITEDKDLDSIVASLNKLVSEIAVSVDNLNAVNEHFTKFIDDIKVVIYNVEKETVKNLAEAGIDEKVKDFIKYKLVLEGHFVNIKLAMSYLVSTMTVIDTCVELK